MSLSKEYQQKLMAYRARCPYWGKCKFADNVRAVAEQFEVESMLDFGCGTGALVETLGKEFDMTGYDPTSWVGINPGPYGKLRDELYDMVTTQDVLEHVEYDHLTATLQEIATRATVVQYHLIATELAHGFFPDGTNCHLIVEEPQWWIDRFAEDMPNWKPVKVNIKDKWYVDMVLVPR